MTSFFRFIPILLFSFLMSPLYAASFDCNKATTETEKAICADPELSALDEFVAASYKLSRNGSSDKQKVLTEQRAWMKFPDNRCCVYSNEVLV